MKTLAKIIIICITILFSENLLAQPGRGLVKQPPRINAAAVRAAANASINVAAKAKIHANSNSVYGTGTTNIPKNDQPKKQEIKKDAVKDDVEGKKTKGKKQKK